MSKLKDYGVVLMRSPLLPLDAVNQIDLKNQNFTDAMYISSPDFVEQVFKKNDLTIKDKEKLDLSVLKYWNRACTRSTPYGLFVSSFIGQVTEDSLNEIRFCLEDYVRKFRLDMGLLFAIVKQLNENPIIQSQLTLFPNNSLYHSVDSIRYVEYTLAKDQKVYQLTSVKREIYIDLLLNSCKSGATVEQLANILKSSETVSFEEAEQFILDLLNAQLLVSHLEPSITGEAPLSELIRKLEKFKGINKTILELSSIEKILSEPDIQLSELSAVQNLLISQSYCDSSHKNLFQADLFLKPQKNALSKSVLNKIIRQVEELLVLQRMASTPDLSSFATRFYKKYEDEEILLTHALDADLGVGYGNALESSIGRGDLIENIKDGSVGSAASNSDYINQFVTKKYLEYLNSQDSQIIITEENLKEIQRATHPSFIYNSLFVVGNLLNNSKEDMNSGDSFHFNLLTISLSGAKILGRFAYANEEFHQLVKDIVTKEDIYENDTIQAEIVHWPQGRIGNIIVRPHFRQYEIPYLGNSGISTDRQIPVQDLLVSVKNGEVILRSKSLGKRINPRLTNAHAFWVKSLPMYKFLGDLQFQNQRLPIYWSWTGFEDQRYLPRVIYKNLVLKKARWKINRNDLKGLPNSSDKQLVFFEVLFNNLKIPRRFVYVEGDTELLIDSSIVEGVTLLIHYINKYNEIELQEYIYDHGRSIVKDEKGNVYGNEIVIPLYRDRHQKENDGLKPIGKDNVPIYDRPKGSKKRKFLPNSEWLTLKVYCGPKVAENLLQGDIHNFLVNKLSENLFQKFFFIRYYDEFNHIRLRFHNVDASTQNRLQQSFIKLLEPHVESGIIHKVIIDTYSRELERYHEDLIDFVEDLFFYDSKSVLGFISLLDDSPDSEFYRLVYAMRSIDQLFEDFSLDLEKKHELTTRMYRAFFYEHGGNPTLQKTLNAKYNDLKKKLFTHMDSKLDIENDIEEIGDLLTIRSKENNESCNNIKEYLFKKYGIEGIYQSLPSYVHMSMNRIFISNQRKYELVIYLFLERYYTSLIAIKKTKKVVSKDK
jgi:thiopeptide-type bacteriocin biosynthesis protein